MATARTISPITGAMRAQMFDNGGCERLLEYLLHEVTVDAYVIKRPLPTEALRDQQLSSLSAERQWLMDILDEGIIPGDARGDGTALTDKLHSSYESALGARGERHTSKEKLGRFLRGYGVQRTRPRIGSARVHAYGFPELSVVRACFDRDLAAPRNWGSETEWAGADAVLGRAM